MFFPVLNAYLTLSRFIFNSSRPNSSRAIGTLFSALTGDSELLRCVGDSSPPSGLNSNSSCWSLLQLSRLAAVCTCSSPACFFMWVLYIQEAAIGTTIDTVRHRFEIHKLPQLFASTSTWHCKLLSVQQTASADYNSPKDTAPFGTLHSLDRCSQILDPHSASTQSVSHSAHGAVPPVVQKLVRQRSSEQRRGIRGRWGTACTALLACSLRYHT